MVSERLQFGNENARRRLLLCLVTVVLCLPVLWVTYAPLVDYPNHLARVHILHHHNDVPSFQTRYERLFEPIPNLAVDLIILFLLQFVSLLTAGKIFLILTIVLFVAGCNLLGRAIHGRPTWLAVPCCFLVYTSTFLYGFVNYVFGVALFCIALAAWLEYRKQWTFLRVAAAAFLVLAAYLSHLSTFFFLGVAFVVVEALARYGEKRDLRQIALGFLPLVPPLAAFALFMRGSGKTGTITWNTIGGKITNAIAWAVSYNYKFDVIYIAAIVLITAWLARNTDRVKIARSPFVAGVVLGVCFLICPHILFTSSAADSRFVLPTLLLLVLSLKIEVPRKVGKMALAAFLVVACVRIGMIWNTWLDLDRQIALRVEQLQVLPAGASVYPVFVLSENREQAKFERALEHSVHYAVVNRQIFVPTIFAIKGQQPLIQRTPPQFATLESTDKTLWLEYAKDYDFVWSYNLSDDHRRLLTKQCDVVSEQDNFVLWRTRRKETEN